MKLIFLLANKNPEDHINDLSKLMEIFSSESLLSEIAEVKNKEMLIEKLAELKEKKEDNYDINIKRES